jgi:hypothetical protein
MLRTIAFEFPEFMKKILFAFLLFLGTTAGFAQAQKGTETKAKTKSKTTSPTAKTKKPAEKVGSETAEQKAGPRENGN